MGEDVCVCVCVCVGGKQERGEVITSEKPQQCYRVHEKYLYITQRNYFTNKRGSTAGGNTTVFFPRPHEKDSIISTFGSADQESLFESRPEKMGPAKEKKTKKNRNVPFVGLVNTKNTPSVQPLSVSITTKDISEKILPHGWFNGVGQDWITKINIMSGSWHWMWTFVEQSEQHSVN